MAREAVTTSYITTKLRRIPNGLLGSNQRTSLSHEHLLPSFPLYIYIYIYSLPGSGLFRRNYIPLPSSLGQENGKSVEIGSRHLRGETWMLRIFHPALNWKIFFHELDDFFSPIQGIRFYIISLNKISLVREMNSSRSIERERERTESEIFCRSMRVCS